MHHVQSLAMVPTGGTIVGVFFHSSRVREPSVACTHRTSSSLQQEMRARAWRPAQIPTAVDVAKMNDLARSVAGSFIARHSLDLETLRPVMKAFRNGSDDEVRTLDRSSCARARAWKERQT